jgi:hypothetical protein
MKRIAVNECSIVRRNEETMSWKFFIGEQGSRLWFFR